MASNPREPLRYVDLCPGDEQQIMGKITAQLVMATPLMEITQGMTKLAKQFQEASATLASMTASAERCGTLQTDVIILLKEFGSTCAELSANLEMAGGRSAAGSLLLAFGQHFLGDLKEKKAMYDKAKGDYDDKLGAWMSIPVAAKPEEEDRAFRALEDAHARRVGLMEVMHGRVAVSLPLAARAVNFCLAAVLDVSVKTLGRFLALRRDAVGALVAKNAVPQGAMGEVLKPLPSWEKTDSAAQARAFWQVRRGRAEDGAARPAGIVSLKKRSGLLAWSRRWARLMSGGKIEIWDPVTATSERNAVGLVHFSRVAKSKKRFAFVLKGAQGEMEFRALTEYDLKQWQAWVEEYNSSILHQTQLDSTETSPYQCADCGAEHASWCSLNLGITLCAKCSGVHRGLSTSVSFVRSVGLDDLHPLVLHMLTMLSNEAINSVFLAKQPGALASRTDEGARSQFIRNKYVGHEWVDLSEPPNPFDRIRQADPFGLLTAMNLGGNTEVVNGLAPIHAAVQAGNVMVATVAACCTGEIDVADGAGWTALAHALYNRSADVARMLVSLGAKAARCANAGLLEMAAASGVLEVVQQRGVKPAGAELTRVVIPRSPFATAWPEAFEIPAGTQELIAHTFVVMGWGQ